MSLLEQVAFDLDGLDARVVPTTHMKKGVQVVHQHSWCGAVVVWHPIPARAELGSCPACDRPDDGWWRQVLPVAGIRSNQEPSSSCPDERREPT